MTDDGPLRHRLAALRPAEDMATASAQLAQAGLTDGLPVHSPHEAAVAQFLAAVPGGDPDRPILPIPLAMAPPTRWDLAACAVMAGCPPAAFGLVVTALAALTDPAFNLLGVQTTTSAVAPFLVVGGVPDAPTLAVGRAVRLALHALGNALPGVTNLSTQGHPGRISWCVAEAADSPWPPIHQERGVAAAVGVTAVAAVGSVELVLGRDRADDDVAVLAAAGDAVRQAGLGPGVRRRQVVAVLAPETAQRLAGSGWTRATVAAALAGQPSEGPPEVLGTADASTGDGLVVVAGGVGIKGTVIQTWGSGEAVTAGAPGR